MSAERVAAAPPLFPVNGILSLSTIRSSGKFMLTGDLRADGNVTINQSSSYVHGNIYYAGSAPSTSFTCNSALLRRTSSRSDMTFW